jgi:superkiller protein 3
MRKAVELDPKRTENHGDLGMVFSALKEHEKAVECYRRAIELQPNNAGVYQLLGNSLRDLKRPDEAVAALRKAVEIYPQFADAHRDLAFILVRQEKFREAIAAYDKALAINPKLIGPYNSLAWLLATCPDARLRDPSRAVTLAKQAVELAPENGGYRNTLGVAYYRAGDWKSAVATLEKSIEMRKGGDLNDWFFLAMAQWQLGNKADARRWYDKSVARMGTLTRPNQEFLRFRAEAAELLGVNEKTQRNPSTAAATTRSQPPAK